eukprot:scaffold69080_cov80-Attheya_sp.AAC.1
MKWSITYLLTTWYLLVGNEVILLAILSSEQLLKRRSASIIVTPSLIIELHSAREHPQICRLRLTASCPKGSSTGGNTTGNTAAIIVYNYPDKWI